MDGPYKKLAPRKDDQGVWRVGSRLLNFVPFTEDKKMPILLPYIHRVTDLVMVESHENRGAHSGHDGTLSQFRSSGFWTTRAGRLAKEAKNNCMECRLADHKTMDQVMGSIPEEVLVNPVAWGHCLSFRCQSKKNH